MQASERDLHELLVVKAASPNTALTLSLTPSSFRTRTKHRDRHHQIIELTDTVQNNLLASLTCR